MALSIVYGYTNTSWSMAYHAFTAFDGSTEHLVIQSVRLPRALIAAAVGASLAIAGAILQTLTKNPLASPDILGINAGAGFFVVVSLSLFGFNSSQAFALMAFIGSAVAVFLMFAISSAGREGMTPMKLTLAGAAIAAMFSSFTQGLLVLDEAALDQVLFWLAGSVQGRKLELLQGIIPYLAAGGTLALLLARKLNVLAMGEDVARGLGLKTGLIKLLSALAVVLLAGGSVAVAGPIGFIGIIIPHLAKKWIGTDHRWLLPFSGLLGAILLIAADIGARYVIMPQEVPVGVMTAVIGVPFFIYIARKGIGTK
ncbi:iron chelate uptake ABC transporter family permease subunit [Bacillus aerolatus]|uniref:Iron chelate uptake ABC transporter family permease subunit n=2 Tax=Bacillus aerolatus TaxID=2653354 RepID=A0A6I1FLY6_9BACI|nr:iron chelate uptake ABC transporter family permease subunit [Bacillus aerolatus]